MEINWIIIAAVLVCAIALILYLIRRNMKDKDDMMNSLNETEIDDELKPKETEEN